MHTQTRLSKHAILRGEKSKSSSLMVYCGCMGSGKSAELIRQMRMLTCAKIPMLCIGHKADLARRDREECGGIKSETIQMATIETHDKASWPALLTAELWAVVGTEEYANSDYIFVDEGQFFPDLVEFIECTRNIYNKNVTIAVLDSDSEMKPFVDLNYLVTHATYFVKTPGICMMCGDDAGHTIVNEAIHKTTQTLVGGFDKYTSCCYMCAMTHLGKFATRDEAKPVVVIPRPTRTPFVFWSLRNVSVHVYGYLLVAMICIVMVYIEYH